MSGTTPIYGLPYQSLTDPPHGPNLGQNLAEAVETELGRIDAKDGPRGYVGQVSRTANGTATTTETIVDSITFNAVAGRRYKISWKGGLASSGGGDNLEAHLRWASGATVTNAGTLRDGLAITGTTSSGVYPASLMDAIPGLPAGQVTVGVGIVRTFGAGTITATAATVYPAKLLVEDVGT